MKWPVLWATPSGHNSTYSFPQRPHLWKSREHAGVLCSWSGSPACPTVEGACTSAAAHMSCLWLVGSFPQPICCWDTPFLEPVGQRFSASSRTLAPKLLTGRLSKNWQTFFPHILGAQEAGKSYPPPTGRGHFSVHAPSMMIAYNDVMTKLSIMCAMGCKGPPIHLRLRVSQSVTL